MSSYQTGCGDGCFNESYYVETEKRINGEVGLMSSSHVDNVAAKNVFAYERSIVGADKKDVGMKQKQGSGGNSYVAYLRARRGACLCD